MDFTLCSSFHDHPKNSGDSDFVSVPRINLLLFVTIPLFGHSTILAWRILWTREPGGLLSIRSHRVGQDWSDLVCMLALEKEWQPTPVFLGFLENPRDRGAWWAAIYGVAQSQTWLKRLSSSSSSSICYFMNHLKISSSIAGLWWSCVLSGSVMSNSLQLCGQ